MTLRYLKSVFLLSAILVLPVPAAAETSEAVTQMTISANIDRSGAMEVAQKIDYDFGPASPHDISFLIPLTYHDDQGREFRMSLNMLDVSKSPGLRTDITTATARITIPAGQAAGSARQFEFKYRLSPVVLRGVSDDILKFNVTGLGWTAPINQTTFQLQTPVAPSDTLTCYTGSSGSTTGQCSVDQQGNVSKIVAYAPLRPGEGLNIFGNFPHNSFDAYLQSYEENPSSPTRKIVELIVVIVVLTLGAIGLASWLRRRYTNANEAAKDQANRD